MELSLNIPNAAPSLDSPILFKPLELHLFCLMWRRGDAHWVDDLAFKKCESQLDQLNAGITSLLVRSIAMKRFLPIPLLDGIISYVVRRNRLIPPKYSLFICVSRAETRLP